MSRSGRRPSPNICDLQDREFTQGLMNGAAIGIPLVYLITLMIMLAAAAGAAAPAMLAFLPAVVGGPFFGAFAVFSFSAGHRRPATVQAVALPAAPVHRRAA